MLSQDGNSLLDHAKSRLSPEVFSHPVWIRFGKKAVSSSPGIIDDLLSAAENFQNDDPSTACQILLICSVYQNYGGQHFLALRTTQQALAVAEHNNLARETLWAIWGVCAISVQQGNYEQAVGSLVDLQGALSLQKDWILAGFVDVLRQSFFQPGTVPEEKHSRPEEDRLFRDMLAFISDWLQQWGFSAEAIEPEIELTSRHPVQHATKQSALTHSFFSIQHWRGRWHTLILAIRSELRLQWIENDPVPAKSQVSFWEPILRSFRLLSSGGKPEEPQVREEVPQIPSISVLPSLKEKAPLNITTRRKKPGSKIKKTRKHQNSAQASAVTPVAVHMLGAFRVTICDTTVKLPASRGLSLFKYLLLRHKRSTSREVLMDVFWPDAEPELARNNLNVAIHSLRKALRQVVFLPVIAFQDGAYGFEPNLQVWLDVEEFDRCVRAGQRLETRDQLTAAVTEYEAAISLYQGDFLEQNPYEEWTVLDRERLRIAYLDTLDRLSQIYFYQERYVACITVCQLILPRDRCREDAHCMLMRCYSRQGQFHLALRQYQICIEALRDELDVSPAPETTNLHDRIRLREHV